jgi:hypothetical protein
MVDGHQYVGGMCYVILQGARLGTDTCVVSENTLVRNVVISVYQIIRHHIL